MIMITKTLLMTCWFGTDLYWHWQKKVSARPSNAAICSTSPNEVCLHECTTRHLSPFIVHAATTTCRKPFRPQRALASNTRPSTSRYHLLMRGRLARLSAGLRGGRGFCFASASLERSCDVNHDAYSITSYVISQLWHNLKGDAVSSKMLAINVSSSSHYGTIWCIKQSFYRIMAFRVTSIFTA